jgi:ATP-dependent protease ClpP protease subunit
MRVIPDADKRGDWFKIVDRGPIVSENGDTQTVTEIYIYDEIGYWGTNASDFVKLLMGLDSQQIDLHINSPGGDVFDGVAIYNALKARSASGTTIKVFVDALAASAASFIAQAGDEILMTRNATMMIHDASGLTYGNAKDMQDMADLLNRVSNNIADIYAQQAGGTKEEWRAYMQEETWYSSDEAVEAGLAHSVLQHEDKTAQAASNNWNLSIFNHASRSEAPSPEDVRKKLASITNRAKEAPVSGTPAPPKNTDTPPEGTPVPEAPPEGTPVPEAPPEGTPVPEEEDDTTPVPPTVENNAAGKPIFVVNGRHTTDPKQVQAHITALETSASEQKTANRKGFVQNLVDGKKLSVAQQKETEEFVLELNDKQYDKYVASMTKAPKMSLLEKHGEDGHPVPTPTLVDEADELETLNEIIAQHKRSGLSQATIEATPTWARLQQLTKS